MAAATERTLPAGQVTLLFTDIEGSTRIAVDLGQSWGDALADHNRLLRDVWAAHGGVEVSTEGDAFFVAFATASEGVAAAAAAQLALASHRWPPSVAIRVRMGLHTGAPQIRDDDYWGVDVHYAARLCAAARGGQVILSATTRALAGDAKVDDLGEHAVKDFPAPRNLYHLIYDGRTSADFPPPRTLSVARTNLPSTPGALMGREDELAHLRERLTGGARLVTLTGIGGSGKTRLALASGASLIDAFSDGVFLAALAAVEDPGDVPRAIADAVGARHDDADPEGAIASHLRSRRLLLVLDNVEHVLEAAPIVARLLDAAPGVAILATSQAPLRLRGEEVVPVPTLPVPDPAHDADAETLERCPAVALLCRLATAADPAFALTQETAPAVAELCRRLDGLPLALELAAARIRLGGPERILAGLDRGVDALGAGPRDLPERQRGLRAAMEWTVSLLSEPERELLAALGAFAEAWTIEQAEELLGASVDVWEAMAALLDFSLVRTRGDGRLTMAETVRAYARELLEADGREADVRRAHAALMAAEAERICDEILLNLHAEAAHTRDLTAEFEHALAWSATADPDLHRRLVCALGMPYYFGGDLAGLRTTLEAQRREPVDDLAGVRLRLGLAMVATSASDDASAVTYLTPAVGRAEQEGKPRLEAIVRTVIAFTMSWSGRLEEALRSFAEIQQLPQVAGDPRLSACVRGYVAISLAAGGRYEEAEPLLAEVLAPPRGVDFPSEAAPSMWADSAVSQGRWNEGVDRYATCLRRFRATQLHNSLLQIFGIACALSGAGRPSDAVELMAGVRGVSAGLGIHIDPKMFPPARELLPAAEAALSPEELAAASARGGALDHDALCERALALAAEVTADAPAGMAEAS